MGSEEASIAVVNEQLRSINIALADIKKTVEKQAEEVGKLAVIEERYSMLARSLERAFNEIKVVSDQAATRAEFNDDFRTQIQDDLQKHKSYTQKYVYFASGFMCALTVLWAVVGAYFIDTTKTAVEITQAYKYGRLPPPQTPGQNP